METTLPDGAWIAYSSRGRTVIAQWGTLDGKRKAFVGPTPRIGETVHKGVWKGKVFEPREEHEYLGVEGEGLALKFKLAKIKKTVSLAEGRPPAEKKRSVPVFDSKQAVKVAQDAYLLMLQMPMSQLRVRNQSVLAQTRDFIAKATGRTAEDVQHEFEDRAADIHADYHQP